MGCIGKRKIKYDFYVFVLDDENDVGRIGGNIVVGKESFF